MGTCSKRVFSTLRSDVGGHICTRNAKVVENGKPFCALHSVAGQAEKERKFQEKYAAHRAADNEIYAKRAYNSAAGNWCRARGMTIEELQAKPEPGCSE